MTNTIDTAKAALQAYNDKDWNKVRALVTDNVVYDEKATNRRIQGPGQVIESWQGWATAFPDSKGTVVNTYEHGNTAIQEVVWKGTHTGPLHTPNGVVPATNKGINVSACQVIKVENGKVTSYVHYFDMLTLLTQIGVTK